MAQTRPSLLGLCCVEMQPKQGRTKSLINVRRGKHMNANDADFNHQQARKEKMLGIQEEGAPRRIPITRTSKPNHTFP